MRTTRMELRDSKMRSVQALMDEWLPADAYVVVIEGADQVLADEPEMWEALLVTLGEAAGFWSEPVTGNGRFDRPARPFHVLLHMGPGSDDVRSHVIAAAKQAGVELEVDEHLG